MGGRIEMVEELRVKTEKIVDEHRRKMNDNIKT